MQYRNFINNKINIYMENMRSKEKAGDVLRIKIESIVFFKEYLSSNLTLLEDNELWIDDDMIKLLLKQLKIILHHFPFQGRQSEIVRRELNRLVLFLFNELKVEREKAV